jgi:hypothetical protein
VLNDLMEQARAGVDGPGGQPGPIPGQAVAWGRDR